MVKRKIRIALLLCDTPLPAVVAESGTYLDIYRQWLQESITAYPDAAISQDIELILDGYDVVDKHEYPAREKLVAGAVDGYDAVMLTGSKHSAYDMSNPFVLPLIDFVRSVATSPATEHVKIIGVCFGHQIISLALGGDCVKGEKGWEIGVYANQLTPEGQFWWRGEETQGGRETIYVEQMHRDHVPALPPGFHLLARSEKYPIHSMIKYHSSSTQSNPLAHILTIQGHPEFTPSIVSHVVDARASTGIFDPEVTAEALRRLGGKDGSGGEGLGRVGWAIWRVLLQDLPMRLPDDEAMDQNPPEEVARYLAAPHRYADVDKVLDRRGPWTAEEFVGGSTAKEVLRSMIKILVIGAGGLGCEILQNLALTGFHDIHVIDMDTIDISNLNRQFLFRESDVGKPKATVAAEFVMKRVPGVTVTPYFGKIQDHPPSFYGSFQIIIAGLDSIAARRWINATLVQMVDEDTGEGLVPLIDGGTEGFKGQSRVILPTITSCYECSLHMLTPPTAFPICTIANTPRLPEHCIEWASVLEWPKNFKEKKLDTDDPDHIEWLYKQASARAAEFNIEGVTWQLTQGVVKNVIPAIASTNAIIAASCCNEAFKLATTCAPRLDNYMMYNGSDSLFTHTFESDKEKDCPVCGGESISAKIGKDWILERFVEWLAEQPNLQIRRPSLSYSSGAPLFYQAPPQMFESTKGNLSRSMAELFGDGDEIVVTDPGLPFSLTVTVSFV